MGNFTPLKKVNRRPKFFLIITYILLAFVAITASTYFLYAKKMLFFKIKCIPGQLVCQRDNPLICLGHDILYVGAFCDSSGNKYVESSCNFYTGCEDFIYSRSDCNKKGFQGCNAYNHQENCFCVNERYSCVADVERTSCGLNPPGGLPTPFPTPAIPTLPLTPTVIPTLILEPATSTPTPTIGPT